MTITRIKVLNGHAAHARFNAQLSEECVGKIQRGYVNIPSPYAYSQTWTLWDWNGRTVFIAETRQRRFEVYEVIDPTYVVETADGRVLAR